MAKGLHCTQGNMAAGKANAAKVPIANQVYHLAQELVSLSKVIPNEILLRLIAIVDSVNPVAP